MLFDRDNLVQCDKSDMMHRAIAIRNFLVTSWAFISTIYKDKKLQ